MKQKTMVLYNNIDTRDFENMREYLFETYAEEEGWEAIDEIPDCVVQHEINEENRRDWENFICDIDILLSKDTYLLTGTCGRWNGPAEGGKFIHNINDLTQCIQHLDYIKIVDENGHLKIYGYHHDGSDSYELKRLTKKGYAFAYKYYFARDRQLHRTIMNNNFYSALPRMAERLYGV